MEAAAAAPSCWLLLFVLVMLLPGTKGLLLLVQRRIAWTIVLQESIGKGVGGAQVLEMDKSAGTAIDFKYAIIGTALGVAISAGFLALKIWMIRRHLSDNDSADLKNTPQDTILQKKRSPRDARVIEL